VTSFENALKRRKEKGKKERKQERKKDERKYCSTAFT